MPALSLCFHVHQPYRLRPFSFFDVGKSTEYFDASRTKDIMQLAASKVYLPVQATLERVFTRHGDEFQCAFLISGTAIEQMGEFAPDALVGFRRLAERASVEVLGSTYYHSLAALLVNPEEFLEQTTLHRELLKKELGVEPRVFCCPAPLYSDVLAELLPQVGFSGVILDQSLGAINRRIEPQVYRAISGDVRIAASVSPVDIEGIYREVVANPGALIRKLQEMVRQEDDFFCVQVGCDVVSSDGEVSELPAFVEGLIDAALKTPGWRFVALSRGLQSAVSSEVLARTRQEALEQIEASKASLLGNSMQRKAFQELYEGSLVSKADKMTWRRVQCVDHIKHMSTQNAGPMGPLRALTGFESPYDVFITYMNILRAISRELAKE